MTILDTTSFQKSSLLQFAYKLGYIYQGYGFELRFDKGFTVKNVSFKDMVEAHNSKPCNVTNKAFRKDILRNHKYSYQDALKVRKVEQAYLQRKKGGEIISNKHLVQFNGIYNVLDVVYQMTPTEAKLGLIAVYKDKLWNL